jgi:hypothetical protein
MMTSKPAQGDELIEDRFRDLGHPLTCKKLTLELSTLRSGGQNITIPRHFSHLDGAAMSWGTSVESRTESASNARKSHWHLSKRYNESKMKGGASWQAVDSHQN